MMSNNFSVCEYFLSTSNCSFVKELISFLFHSLSKREVFLSLVFLVGFTRNTNLRFLYENSIIGLIIGTLVGSTQSWLISHMFSYFPRYFIIPYSCILISSIIRNLFGSTNQSVVFDPNFISYMRELINSRQETSKPRLIEPCVETKTKVIEFVESIETPRYYDINENEETHNEECKSTNTIVSVLEGKENKSKNTTTVEEKIVLKDLSSSRDLDKKKDETDEEKYTQRIS